MVIVCSAQRGCLLDGIPMERVSFQEVQRLQAAGENMFVNAVRCYAHASMWHIRGRTIRLLGGQSTQQEDRS